MDLLWQTVDRAKIAQSHEDATERDREVIKGLLTEVNDRVRTHTMSEFSARYLTKRLERAIQDAEQSALEAARSSLVAAIGLTERYPKDTKLQAKALEGKILLAMEEPEATREMLTKKKDEIMDLIRIAEKIEALEEEKDANLRALKETMEIAKKYVVETNDDYPGIENFIGFDETVDALGYSERVVVHVQGKDLQLEETIDLIQEANNKLTNALAVLLTPPSEADLQRLERAIAEAKLYESEHLASNEKLKVSLKRYVTRGEEIMKKEEPLKAEVIDTAEYLEQIVSWINETLREEQRKLLEESVTEANQLLNRPGLSLGNKRALEAALLQAERTLKDTTATGLDYLKETEKLKEAIERAKPHESQKPITDDERAYLKQLVQQAERAKDRGGISLEDSRNLNAAIAQGNKVLSNPRALKKEYEEAVERLLDAIEQAKPVGQPPSATDERLLDRWIDEAVTAKGRLGISEGDVAILEEALDFAYDVRFSESSTNLDYQEAIEKLIQAIEDTKEANPYEPPASIEDIEKLEDKIKEAEDQLEQLSDEDRKQLEDAIAQGKEALKNPEATEKDIQNAVDGIDASLDKIAIQKNKEKLRQLIEEANGLHVQNVDRTNLQRVIDQSGKVLEDSSATNDKITKQITALSNAMAEYNALANEEKEKEELRKELREQIDQVTKKLEKATDKGKKTLQDAISEAKKILNEPRSGKEALRGQIDQLKKAEENAEYKVSEETTNQLHDLIREAEKVMKDKGPVMKTADQNKLKEAIELAEKVANDINLSEAKVQEEYDELASLLDSIVYLASTEQFGRLEKNIDRLEKIIENMESSHKKSLIEGAIDKGNELLETQDEQDNRATEDAVVAKNKKLKGFIEEYEQQYEQQLAREKEQLEKNVESLKTLLDKFNDEWEEQRKVLEEAEEMLENQENQGLDQYIQMNKKVVEAIDAIDPLTIKDKDELNRRKQELVNADKSNPSEELRSLITKVEEILKKATGEGDDFVWEGFTRVEFDDLRAEIAQILTNS